MPGLLRPINREINTSPLPLTTNRNDFLYALSSRLFSSRNVDSIKPHGQVVTERNFVIFFSLGSCEDLDIGQRVQDIWTFIQRTLKGDPHGCAMDSLRFSTLENGEVMLTLEGGIDRAFHQGFRVIG